MRIIASVDFVSSIVALSAAMALANYSLAQEIDQTRTTTTTTVIRTAPLPPPPPKHEVIVAEPSPACVWIPGNWEREPDKWVWAAGRWVEPPFVNARYVPGYWMYNQSNYAWQPGHWATAEQGLVVAKPIAPPPTFQEVIPVAPAPEQVWVAGHWNWNGLTWVWMPGFYAAPPQPKAVWVAGHWRKGLLGAYRWTPGHWAIA